MYIVDINADEPIMLINRHIGIDSADGPGIIGDVFQQELLQLDALGKKRIQVWINSPGGTVMDGYAIYNAILRSKTKVDTYCIGIAASIAAVIFQAGRKRYIADYGILMYHNPFGGDSTKGLEAMRQSLVKMIETRCGMDEQAVTKMMNRETFIAADEAIQMGLADEIEQSADHNRRRLLPIISNNVQAYWKESNVIVNTLFKTSTNMSLLKVTNKLGLNEAANEDAILNGITAIENRAVTAEKELVTAKADIGVVNSALTDTEDKLKKSKDEYDKLKNEYDALKKKEDDAENALKTEKAKNLVNKYAVAGRIKTDTVDAWVKKAEIDLDGTKNLLDSIAVSKDAVKIEDAIKDEKNKTSGLENAVGSDMARIRNKYNLNAVK